MPKAQGSAQHVQLWNWTVHFFNHIELNSYFESLNSYFESLNSYFESLNSYFESLNGGGGGVLIERVGGGGGNREGVNKYLHLQRGAY